MAVAMDPTKPGIVPWLGSGNKVANNMTPEAMLKAAKCDWTVSLRETAFKNAKGEWVLDKTKMKLVRDSDGTPLTTCSPRWNPVQNADAAGFFKKFVTEGKMSMEHMGSLAGGKYLWALANIGKDFDIAKDDQVRNYLLMIQPHVQGKAMVFKFMSARAWCWNTLAYLLGGHIGKKGTIGHGFRMTHSLKFDDAMKKRAAEALGLAVKQTEEMKTATLLLAKKKATTEQVEEFFCEVLKFDPKDKENTMKKDGTPREPLLLPKFREALALSPGQHLASAKGTWWGAVNAVSFVVDHSTGRTDDGTSLRSAWMGNKSRLKARAMELALDAAK
jgi:phage/plasmid-like protein (TIGR03299 family)